MEEYNIFMKKQLSNPQQITEDGTINHKYFLNKKGQYWSPEHDLILSQKIEQYGVGNHYNIRNSHNLLVQKTETEIELRTCILLGTNDISEYSDQNLTVQQQTEIKQSNLIKSKQNGKLKYGINYK